MAASNSKSLFPDDPSHLLPATLTPLITSWLQEDTPSFDYGGFVVGDAPADARLLGKSPGILAGAPFVDEVFRQLGCTVEWRVREGTGVGGEVGSGIITGANVDDAAAAAAAAAGPTVTECAVVRGPIRNILLGERVALNCLARCSGIASQTRRMVRLLRSVGYQHTLAGTRKTTPGFRLVEKYGILVGGGDAHRYDLSGMVMLKDNHIWSCADAESLHNSGSEVKGNEEVTYKAIGNAVQKAKGTAGFTIKVEVECQSFGEAAAAIEAGADVVMLDNFAPRALKSTAARLKEVYKDRRFLLEVSGGLTEENVREFVCDDLDVISTSSIHQGVKHVDFSLKVVRQ